MSAGSVRQGRGASRRAFTYCRAEAAYEMIASWQAYLRPSCGTVRRAACQGTSPSWPTGTSTSRAGRPGTAGTALSTSSMAAVHAQSQTSARAPRHRRRVGFFAFRVLGLLGLEPFALGGDEGIDPGTRPRRDPGKRDVPHPLIGADQHDEAPGAVLVLLGRQQVGQGVRVGRAERGGDLGHAGGREQVPLRLRVLDRGDDALPQFARQRCLREVRQQPG